MVSPLFQCSGGNIALSFRMFIALLFYKFLLLTLYFQIVREFIVLPTLFLAPGVYYLTTVYINTLFLLDYVLCIIMSIVTLFYNFVLWFLSQNSLHYCLWGFIVYLFYTIDFLFCIYMVFPLSLLYMSSVTYALALLGSPRRSLDRYGVQTWTWASLPGYPHGTFLKFILH